MRVKKLEKKRGSRTHRLKRLYKVGRSRRVKSSEDESLGDQEDASKQGRIYDIDADKDIYLVNVYKDDDMFGVNDLEGDEVVVESEIADKDVKFKTQEQEELFDAEKATLFVQLLEKRRKYFTAKRAEEKRNRPPTKAQQRSFMCTYLKNMEGWKPKDLKNKSFANIHDLFDKAMKRVNTFVDMDTELVKESSKKAEAEIAQESGSKRSGEALEQESSELRKRADGNSQMYLTFGKMLKNFDKEDLEVLWSIVKARFKKQDPVNYLGILSYILIFIQCLNIILKIINILYLSLVEKMYPLTKHTLHQMFNDVKLQVDYEYEMAFELLRLVKKQLKEGNSLMKY
ncbi:hypothetical protein Tco_1056328 [Tanacetum coccineum]|uniref:Uncharacterized protein n=1 Tax=Tanacetum coccineum TaxID=301880 RepID=A0ABQ5H3B7_9ASTR